MKFGEISRNLPTLETDRLILRKMTTNDAEAVFAYASDPEVTRYVVWDTHRSIQDSRAFLELAVQKYKSGGEPDWGIVYKGDHRFVGTCGFVGWDVDHARAEIGYVLSREYWGRGLMPEALRAMIAFGFERMSLNRIEARCIAENAASARVMEKVGMTYEGMLRQREFIKGAYRDMKLYAILKSEYRPRQQGLTGHAGRENRRGGTGARGSHGGRIGGVAAGYKGGGDDGRRLTHEVGNGHIP